MRANGLHQNTKTSSLIPYIKHTPDQVFVFLCVKNRGREDCKEATDQFFLKKFLSRSRMIFATVAEFQVLYFLNSIKLKETGRGR